MRKKKKKNEEAWIDPLMSRFLNPQTLLPLTYCGVFD